MAMLGTETRIPLPAPGGAAEDIATATCDGFPSAAGVMEARSTNPEVPASGEEISDSGSPGSSSPPDRLLPNGSVAAQGDPATRLPQDNQGAGSSAPSSKFLTTHRTSSNTIIITPIASTATTSSSVQDSSNPANSSPTAPTPIGTSAASNTTTTTSTTTSITTVSAQTDSNESEPASGPASPASCDSGSVGTAGEDSASGDDELSASSASISAAASRRKKPSSPRKGSQGSRGSAVSPSRWRRSWPWSRFRRRRRDK
ncbi:hypothetical protein ElyMa_006565800, partial [Elysia marginata]